MAEIIGNIEIRITDLKPFSDLINTLVDNVDALPPKVVDAIYALREALENPNAQE